MPGQAPPQAPEGGKVKLAPLSRIFPNEAFGYRQITVERPLRVAYSYSFWANVERLPAVKALELGDQNRLGDILHDEMKGARFLTRTHFVEALQMLFQSASAEHFSNGKLVAAITDASAIPDPEGEIAKDKRGNPKPNSSLRDTETVPLSEDVETYFRREVLPHAPDAWIDDAKTKVGYEIPFNRHFYVFEPPRPLEEIDIDLARVTERIQRMLTELSA